MTKKNRKRTKKAVDRKMAAANDRPKSEATLTKKAISARTAGVKLFVAAGRPTQTQLVRVFGKDGVKWTWTARAKHAGLASAEEAAAKFQDMLAAKQGR